MTPKIVVIDTETAAMDGPVCDLAVIQIDEELEIVNRVESLIDPLRKMAPAAQAVHGITDAMVADQPTMAEFLEDNPNPFAVEEGQDLYVIGHNVQFDCRMLADLLPQRYFRVCTLRMARNQWTELHPTEENHKLGTLAIMFNLETGPAHRAMGDAITCLSLFRYLADVTGAASFYELAELGRRPLTLDSKMTFGKHQGMRLRDLPRDYVAWILRQKDFDPELVEALSPR